MHLLVQSGAALGLLLFALTLMKECIELLYENYQHVHYVDGEISKSPKQHNDSRCGLKA